MSDMTNAALELAKIFRTWRELGQTTGDNQLSETASLLGLERHEALFHVATLLSGVQTQLAELESQELDTVSFRATEAAWINAAFMTTTGWGSTSRHPDHIISEANVNLLHSLGVMHQLARLNDGQKNTLFEALLLELTPTLELIESLNVPEMLKSLAIRCATSLKNYLEQPRVDVEVVMSKYSELVGLLATMAVHEQDEDKANQARERAILLVKSVSNAVAVDLLSRGLISGGTLVGTAVVAAITGLVG